MITFEPEDQAQIVAQIKRYFHSELQQEIGQIDAELLLGGFTQQVASAYYNLGLRDARVVREERLRDVGDALYEIEQPVTYPARS